MIYNPVAGWRRRRKLNRVIAAMATAGAHVMLHETTQRGDAERLARTATAEVCDVIAVAGGDGTLNEVINGLGPDAPPVAIIPLGTANVYAAEIGLPPGLEDVARLIMTGPERPIHVGLVNGRRFIQMAGAGFDAHVVAEVTPVLKRKLGKLAYVLKSLAGLFRFSFCRYKVTIDGATYQAASAIIANGHYYGGRFVAAPEARLDSPTLQVCLFERSGPINVIRYGWGLMAGRLKHFPDVKSIAGTHIRVEGPDGEPVQADGDVVATLPLSASMDGGIRAVMA